MKYLILRGTKVARRKGSVAVSKLKSRIWPTVKQCLLFGLLVGYAFAGAVLFHFIEGPAEEVRIIERINNTAELRSTFLEELWNISVLCNGTDAETDCPILFENATLRYEKALEKNLSFYIDLRESSAYRWTFWNAFYYSFTIFTTIGYGNLYCHTRWCRIGTILYALFGIPLVLTLLKYIGQSLFKRSSWVWRKLVKLTKYCVKFFRKHVLRHKDVNITRQPSIATQASMELDDLEAGFPLPLAIAIVLIYIFAIAYAFAVYEGNWDYLDSFYFFFITLSTIGLGDQVPHEDTDGMTYIVGFIIVMVGLALVSMCINVLQNRVEQTYLKTLLKMQNRFVLGSIEDINDADVEAEAGPPSAALGVFRLSRMSRQRSQLGSRRVIEVGGEDGEPVVIVPLRNSSRISRHSHLDDVDSLALPDYDDAVHNSSPSKVRFEDIPEEMEGHDTTTESGIKPAARFERKESEYDNHPDTGVNNTTEIILP